MRNLRNVLMSELEAALSQQVIINSYLSNLRMDSNVADPNNFFYSGPQQFLRTQIL
jgi:hypothetical protein